MALIHFNYDHIHVSWP